MICELEKGRCKHCGWENTTGLPDNLIRRACALSRAGEELSIKAGLGDKIESMLTKLGVTKERYIALKKRLGLIPECNCLKRKELLNKLGRSLKK